jgi:hypothetical protein
LKGEKMTISLDLASLAIGFVIGVVCVMVIFGFYYFDERWSDGFSEGFRSGRDLESFRRKDQNKRRNGFDKDEMEEERE